MYKRQYVDSVLALDLTTGAIKWARSFPEGGADVFTAQVSTGQDSDFGAGANLFTATINGAPKDLVGAGQKSGMYWALDADTGATVWSIQVGSGGQDVYKRQVHERRRQRLTDTEIAEGVAVVQRERRGVTVVERAVVRRRPRKLLRVRTAVFRERGGQDAPVVRCRVARGAVGRRRVVRRA